MRRERRALGTGGARGTIIAGLIVIAGALATAPGSASGGPANAAAAAPGPLSTGRVERFAGSEPYDFGNFSGDGGPAIYAALANPTGVASDGHGNVYIADSGNVRIRRVNANGKITTFAGTGNGANDTGDGGPATRSRLNFPFSVAADGHGNVYLVGESQDGYNPRVRVIDAGGTIRTFAGSETPGHSGDGGRATSALLDHPYRVAADGQGNVYIAERYWIRKVNPSGIISTIAGTGVHGFSGDGGPATAAQVNVNGLAADRQGDVFMAGGARVRRIDHATGTITTVAGTGTSGFSGDGGPATAARISDVVVGLAVDDLGVLYIGDQRSHRVRAVDTSGRITTIVGNGKTVAPGWSGPGRKVSVSLPTGLAVDDHGRLLISDPAYNTVLRFSRGLTGSRAGQCTRAAARQQLAQRGLGDSYDNPDPVAQMFCGPFTGRHSHAMVVSLRLPSCGVSYGWVMFRSVHHRWTRVPNRGSTAAILTRSGRKILEWQGVLGPHDAHCFPSSARVRVWHWNGTRLVHGSWHRKPRVPRHPPGLHL